MAMAAPQARLRVVTPHAIAQVNASGNTTSLLEDSPDPCGAQFWELGCLYDVSCDMCLSRPGCAIDANSGKCVSVSRMQAVVGKEFVENATPGYCADNDAACVACPANTVCHGTEGCACVSQCLTQSTAALQCRESTFVTSMPMVTIFAVLLFLALLMLFVRRAVAQAIAVHRLVHRDPARSSAAENPMVLKLEGWRHYMDAHKEQFEITHVELHTCKMQLQACDMVVVDSAQDTAPSKMLSDVNDRSSRASTTSAQSCGSFLCEDDLEAGAGNYTQLASPSAANASQQR